MDWRGSHTWVKIMVFAVSNIGSIAHEAVELSMNYICLSCVNNGSLECMTHL